MSSWCAINLLCIPNLQWYGTLLLYFWTIREKICLSNYPDYFGRFFTFILDYWLVLVRSHLPENVSLFTGIHHDNKNIQSFWFLTSFSAFFLHKPQIYGKHLDTGYFWFQIQLHKITWLPYVYFSVLKNQLLALEMYSQ